MKNKMFLYILRFCSKGWDVSFLVLLPFIQKEFHISLIEIGLLSMTYTVGSIISSFFAGYINDLLGNKKTLLLAICLYVVAWLSFMFTRSDVVIWFIFIAGGISSGLISPITDALVMRSANINTRTKEIGDFAATGDLGRIAFTTLTSLMVGFLSLHFTAGIFSLLAVFLLVFLIFSSIQFVHIKDENVQKVGHLDIIKSKDYLLAVASGVCDSFASSSLFIFLPFLLIPKGIDIKFTGLFTALFFAGYFSGRVFLGRLADKHGKSIVLIVAEVCMALLIISLVYLSSYALLFVNLYLLGIVTRGTSPLIKAMVADGMKQDHFEKGYGLYSSITRTSNSLSRPAYSYIGNFLGIGSIFYLSSFVALLTIIPATLFYKSIKKEYN